MAEQLIVNYQNKVKEKILSIPTESGKVDIEIVDYGDGTYSAKSTQTSSNSSTTNLSHEGTIEYSLSESMKDA